MFYQFSKFNCMWKVNQASTQNFPTLIFSVWCQEDLVMLITACKQAHIGAQVHGVAVSVKSSGEMRKWACSDLCKVLISTLELI